MFHAITFKELSIFMLASSGIANFCNERHLVKGDL